MKNQKLNSTKSQIRVDYSGLDWSLIGEPLEKEERCHHCGGKIMFCKKYNTKFCSSCGEWVKDKRPKNALVVLNQANKKPVSEAAENRDKFYYDWPR